MKNTKFKSGDRVTHNTFGTGTVVLHAGYGEYGIIWDRAERYYHDRYYNSVDNIWVRLDDRRYGYAWSRGLKFFEEDVGDLEDDL